PYSTAARVNIGQVLISVRTKDSNKATVIEALRRCKYKFPGRQKIIISKKWGFTKLTRSEYIEARAKGLVVPDGCHVKYLSTHGPLSAHLEQLAA
ncbi:60S ribosomal protein L10, partial [Coemansia sp. RSA 1365]